MAILVTCNCGQRFQTSDQNAGRRARCPECGTELVVPKPNLISFDAPVDLEPVETITSGKAIASLVLGLLSFFCSLVAGIPAIILGLIGLGEIRASKGRVTGSGMATMGVVLGSVGTALMGPAVLIALLLPAVQSAREAARRAQCTNNEKQLALAIHNYISTYNQFPPAAITDSQGQPLLSWRVAILPFVEEQQLYNEFHLDEPWDSPHNIALLPRMPQCLKCPSEPLAPGTTNYLVFVTPASLFPGSTTPVRLQDVVDGTSNTIMIAESATPVPWTSPRELTGDLTIPTAGVGSKHPGGANVAMGDGSVRFLKKTTLSSILSALISRNGGEVVGSW